MYSYCGSFLWNRVHIKRVFVAEMLQQSLMGIDNSHASIFFFYIVLGISGVYLLSNFAKRAG